MAEPESLKKTLLDAYQDVELGPGLYSIDVLGEHVQTGGTNSEWRRFGEALAHRLAIHQQSAVLVSTLNLEHYLLHGDERSNSDNSASFEHESRHYIVTSLDPSRLEHTLPDIVESEEFVLGLNVWLCFFDDAQTSNACVLCKSENTTFVREMKCVISNLNVLNQIKLTLELIAAVSDGSQLLWFNPKI